MQGADTVDLEVRGPAEAVQAALKAIPEVTDVRQRANGAETNIFSVDCSLGADLREQLASTIIQRGWGLRALRPSAVTLEDVFLQLVTTEAPAA